MYIAPNSKIKIYHNVPLDDTYVHTLYFNNITEQNAYFHGNSNILKYSLEEQSYQRVNKGKMRVEQSAENLYDCNYLAFQNTSFGNKWFYAFIKSVEYINNITSEITFEIDPMMTYFFDVELKQSFVEREHTSTDVVGENLLDEKLDVGSELVVNKERIIPSQSSGEPIVSYPVVIIACSEYPTVENPSPTNWVSADPEVVYGVPNSVNYVPCRLLPGDEMSPSGEPAWKKFIKTFIDAGKTDSIIAVYVVPSFWLPANANIFEYNFPSWSGSSIVESMLPTPVDTIFDRNLLALDGYIPKNKKLYNYPYNYLRLVNGQGEVQELKFEFVTSANKSSITIRCFYDISINGGLGAYPIQYIKDGVNYECGISLSDLLQSMWSSDPYAVWLNQGFGKSSINYVVTALTTLIGMINPTFGLLSATASIGSTIGNIITSGREPITPKGKQTGAGLQYASNNFVIRAQEMCPKAEYLRIIDDYFSCYGYACRRVKVPNRNVRPHWTYTKTVGCNLIGNAPADDVAKLVSIYDNGITFWKNPSEVGNYSLDNRV